MEQRECWESASITLLLGTCMGTSKGYWNESFEELELDKIKGPQEKKEVKRRKIDATTKVITEKVCAKNTRWWKERKKQNEKNTKNMKPDGNIVNKSVKKKCCFYICWPLKIFHWSFLLLTLLTRVFCSLYPTRNVFNDLVKLLVGFLKREIHGSCSLIFPHQVFPDDEL